MFRQKYTTIRNHLKGESHLQGRDNAAFKQQKLTSKQLVWGHKSVIFLFLVVGITLLSVGAVALHSHYNIWEVSVDYTDCVDVNSGTLTYI